MDSKGMPLPFVSNEEVEEFLRTARIVEVEEIPVGVNKPLRVLMEQNGLQVNGCFRDVDKRHREGGSFATGWKRDWRDSCKFEYVAYELGKMLGLNRIPPTVLRGVRDKEGTLQIWVEKALMEKRRLRDGIEAPSKDRFQKQWQIMRLFDALIYNHDRNAGNILYDEDWNIWLIDHTRSFNRSRSLPQPLLVSHCERRIWERLKNLDDQLLREMFKSHLEPGELDSLLERRTKLVSHFEKQISERGEEQVLFYLD